jgi:cytoplasmic iron level regulating protein YaaA (DUF328/UPF0246 family)
MLALISPAKKLDYETDPITDSHTVPDFLDDSQQLIDQLKGYAPHELASLMKLSDKLSLLNAERYDVWQTPFSFDNAKQAVLAFQGDVYTGMDAVNFNQIELEFSQQHLRILSGLYGLLRPLDLMQAYRLEMGTRLATERGKNLYEFWGNLVTDTINTALTAQGDDIILNLASVEYFKVVKKPRLKGQLITPIFKDYKNGQYKVIAFYAKKARGLMCRYMIENQITEPEQLKQFDLGGYQYNAAMSSERDWVFLRNIEALK